MIQIKSLILRLKELKNEKTKPKVRRRKELIKIRTEINQIENRKTIEKSIKPSYFFEKVNKIIKPIVRLQKKRRRK